MTTNLPIAGITQPEWYLIKIPDKKDPFAEYFYGLKLMLEDLEALIKKNKEQTLHIEKEKNIFVTKMKLNKRNVRAARQNARRDRVCLEFSFVSFSFFQV